MNYNKGDRVGDYEVVDILGAGGMGRVYKVRNVISERAEAMKVLLPNLESDPDLADRFMREIKVQASLQHPNIAALHTAQRVNNQLIMLIEFVDGATVESELKRGPIPVARAVEYVRQTLLALAYAHKHGVVHRDIKPANIMVMPDGTVKLMDFGIARLSADRKLTQTGRTVGSLFYMSPEQIQGAVDLDGRTDLYSLGVTLYEMVTARRPFQGDSDYSIMAAHLSARPMAPIELDPSLPAALNDVILMAIAKDPAQRFQTADAFRSALSSVTGAPVPVQSPVAAAAAPVKSSPPPPPPRPVPVQAVPPQAAPPAAPIKPGNSRGLYIAIGSLVTVAVLVVAALQVPKLLKSDAASTAPSAMPAAQAPVQQTAPPLVQDAPPAQSVPVQQAQPVASTPAPSRPVQSVPASVPSQRPAPAPVGIAQNPVPQPAAPVQQPVVTQPPPQTQTTATAPAPQPSGPDPALAQYRELLMMHGTRANTAKASLNALRQQQARMGATMRQDITTQEGRMDFFLDEAQSALRAGDAARAKKNLDAAERALETIEKFLGR